MRIEIGNANVCYHRRTDNLIIGDFTRNLEWNWTPSDPNTALTTPPRTVYAKYTSVEYNRDDPEESIPRMLLAARDTPAVLWRYKSCDRLSKSSTAHFAHGGDSLVFDKTAYDSEEANSTRGLNCLSVFSLTDLRNTNNHLRHLDETCPYEKVRLSVRYDVIHYTNINSTFEYVLFPIRHFNRRNRVCAIQICHGRFSSESGPYQGPTRSPGAHPPAGYIARLSFDAATPPTDAGAFLLRNELSRCEFLSNRFLPYRDR
ncbi:hypothetical protein EVAR_14450_1 [Eumeta japonica]|uniref:Uncharacterized protein n=1 Tax=Eumeta variegata TaxID=151549 RepID=A0A4C1U2Y1_EUMVA|nr:hypothetical protein EVAR_14450_1 [Eumeta japonica]